MWRPRCGEGMESPRGTTDRGLTKCLAVVDLVAAVRVVTAHGRSQACEVLFGTVASQHLRTVSSV